MKSVFLIAVLNINEQTFLKICDYLIYLTLQGSSHENTVIDTGVETLNFPFPLPCLLHPRRNQRQTKKKKPKATKQREDVESAASIYRLME